MQYKIVMSGKKQCCNAVIMTYGGALFVDMLAHMFGYMIDHTENTNDKHVAANKDETLTDM